jgi:hypothetical protein
VERLIESIDVAVLTVEDGAFWVGIEPLRFGGIPNLQVRVTATVAQIDCGSRPIEGALRCMRALGVQDAVVVVGYPTGGDNISVTCGVVWRVDMTQYSHGCHKLLAIQIDAGTEFFVGRTRMVVWAAIFRSFVLLQRSIRAIPADRRCSSSTAHGQLSAWQYRVGVACERLVVAVLLH